MKNFFAFVAGGIFSVGLILAGMTDPNIVLGFLDLFGEWNPRLAFVMGGAVAVNLILFRVILKKEKPKLAESFSLPTKTDLDKRLIAGSALFGIGWGILGVCPGPGIVNIVTLEPLLLTFVGAMIVGMFVHKFAIKD